MVTPDRNGHAEIAARIVASRPDEGARHGERDQRRGPALARRRRRTSRAVLNCCDALFVHEEADVGERVAER